MELWGYEVINPFDHDAYARRLRREQFNATQEGNKQRLEELCPLIYEKDIKNITESDVVVAYYPDESTGTSQEIGKGREFNKLVIVLTDMIHPFIQTPADYVISIKNDEGIEKLRDLLKEYSGEQNV